MAKDKIEETKELLTQQLVPKNNETTEQFEKRKKAFKSNQISKLKELLLQDVTKNNTNRTFTQYTKSLIKTYLNNPYSYKDSIREVSRYLYRVCTLYKKIVLYYAAMPEYNYNVTPKVDLSKEFSVDMKKYGSLLQRLQLIDFKREFSTAIALAIRDGVYCAFVYDNEDSGLFFHVLDPQYLKIRGKNERGQWVPFFDATYFTKGSNSQFVLGVNGDTSGCWDQIFIDGYNQYESGGNDYRWFALPPEKTITLVGNLDDEFDLCLPWYASLFTSLLDLMDYEQLIADKTELENFVLLVSKIPLIDGDTVDDFKLSIEMVQAMQELIDAVVPELCGTAYSPMDLDVVSFKGQVNTTEDTDNLNESINRIFTQAGPPALVVSGGTSTNSVGLKYSLLGDLSIVVNMWLSKLESAFQYYIDSNIDENYIFKLHLSSWFNHTDYVTEMRELATLGKCSSMDLITAANNTPYEAMCKIKFEASLDFNVGFIPAASSYNTSSDVLADEEAGRPESDDSDLSEEGAESRTKRGTDE